MTTRRHIRKAVVANAQRRRIRAAIGERQPSGQGYPGPGAVNAYRCGTCAGYTVTIHRAAGQTPQTIACQALGCDGRALSGMYAMPASRLPAPTHEWYRPSPLELAPGIVVQVAADGLALRPVSKADAADALAEMVRDGQRLSLYERDPERLQTALRNARSRRSAERRADGEKA